MPPLVSIIIPNYNGSPFIGLCLEAALASDYENMEILVVDDKSTDNSIEIIENFPCRLVRLEENRGASTARNAGAREARGEILFFIDADCLLQTNTITVAVQTLAEHSGNTVIGGTYTLEPFDRDFYSTFQSVFINYSETKNLTSPDYLASHALIISAQNFKQSGGFDEEFMAILEDVEYSHRLRRQGFILIMSPDILVQHIFQFSLLRSLKNAFRKSKYWTRYSMKNKDLFADSGTASLELKVNVAAWGLAVMLLGIGHIFQETAFLIPLPFCLVVNLILNRKFFSIFRKKLGPLFAVRAALYYICLYPLPISAGIAVGTFHHLLDGQE